MSSICLRDSSVPRRVEYVPKHRGPASEPALKKGIRKSFLYSGVAVAATGIAVSSGVLAQDNAVGDSAAASLSAATGRHDVPSADLSERRDSPASRSDERTSLDDAKKDALDQDSGGQETKTEDLSQGDPRDIARAMLADYGFSASEFSCLDSLYVSESDWNPHADNPTSSAYGIPQALTGGTHDDLPADYMTNPASQIAWGLDYIKASYGTPCSAWSFKQSHGWY
jgi:hypothetical protein